MSGTTTVEAWSGKNRGDENFPVGSLLPTELELVDRYQTSRHTVRAALHELEQLGFVSRRKKLGTRVESAQPKNEFRPSLASLDDLVQFGTTHLRKVQSIGETTVTGVLAKELRCASGTRWLRISSLRVEADDEGSPIGWTDVYVDPAYAEIGKIVRKSPDTLISSLIESRYGRRVAEVRQDIRAEAGWRGGPVEVRESAHRRWCTAGRHQLRRGPGAAVAAGLRARSRPDERRQRAEEDRSRRAGVIRGTAMLTDCCSANAAGRGSFRE